MEKKQSFIIQAGGAENDVSRDIINEVVEKR